MQNSLLFAGLAREQAFASLCNLAFVASLKLGNVWIFISKRVAGVFWRVIYYIALKNIEKMMLVTSRNWEILFVLDV